MPTFISRIDCVLRKSMMKTPLISGRTSTSGWCHLSFSRITDCMEICAAPTMHSSRPGPAVGHLVRAAGHVAGDGDLALRDVIEGQRIAGAAVDQEAPVELDGPEERRNRDRSGDCRAQQALARGSPPSRRRSRRRRSSAGSASSSKVSRQELEAGDEAIRG